MRLHAGALLLLNVLHVTALTCLPASMTYSGDVRLVKVGDWLNISCRASPFHRGQLATARLLNKDRSVFIEYYDARVVANRLPNAADYVIAVVLQDGIMFTFRNIKVNDSKWIPVGCELHVNRTELDSYCVMQRRFHKTESLGMPVVAWNAARLTEGESMPPVTCMAVGSPHVTLTMQHLASNGTRLQDVRAVRSTWQTTVQSDGSLLFSQLHEIGCWQHAAQCSPLSRSNHGDWLVCTVQSENEDERSARKQLHVDYRLDTLRVFDSMQRPLHASEHAQFDDSVVLLPNEKRRRLQYACVANGRPQSAVAWIGKEKNSVGIVQQENDSLLVLELQPDLLERVQKQKQSTVTLDSLQCLAVQHFHSTETVVRHATVNIQITAQEWTEEKKKNNMHSWVLLLAFACGTLVIFMLLFSVYCCRKTSALLKRIISKPTTHDSSEQAVQQTDL